MTFEGSSILQTRVMADYRQVVSWLQSTGVGRDPEEFKEHFEMLKNNLARAYLPPMDQIRLAMALWWNRTK